MAERKDGDGWDEYYRLRGQIEAAKADEMRRLNEWCDDLSKGQKEINDKVGRIDVAVARLEEAARAAVAAAESRARTVATEAARSVLAAAPAPARQSTDTAGFISGMGALLVAIATAIWVALGKQVLP